MRTPPDIEARRAAKRIGLIARRSRRYDDNLGGFMLIEPDRNVIVVGARFDLTQVLSDQGRGCKDFWYQDGGRHLFRSGANGTTVFDTWKLIGEPLPKRGRL